MNSRHCKNKIKWFVVEKPSLTNLTDLSPELQQCLQKLDTNNVNTLPYIVILFAFFQIYFEDFAVDKLVNRVTFSGQSATDSQLKTHFILQYRQRGSRIGPRYRHGIFIVPAIHHRGF